MALDSKGCSIFQVQLFVSLECMWFTNKAMCYHQKYLSKCIITTEKSRKPNHCIYICVFSRWQELQYVELFAGVANVWRCVSHSYAAARVDIDYNKQDKYCSKQNPMDILTSAGWSKLSYNHNRPAANHIIQPCHNCVTNWFILQISLNDRWPWIVDASLCLFNPRRYFWL